jgi:4'-phosphopantetheinyl transferase
LSDGLQSLDSVLLDGVELWLLDLDRSPPGAIGGEASLSAHEQERAGRFVFDADRRRYELAHRWMRRILAERQHTSPHALNLGYSAQGKPYLLGLDPADRFNLSHSEHLALLGISRHAELGVDIEWRRSMDDLASLAANSLGQQSLYQWHQLPATERLDAFLHGWARREACLKAIGCGLADDVGDFDPGMDCGPRRLQLRWAAGQTEIEVNSSSRLHAQAVIAAARCLS